MACFYCKKEYEVEKEHKRKETLRCKLGIHRLNKTLCLHEDYYRICLDCGRFIEINDNY